PDADNRDEPGAPCRQRLRPDIRIGLAAGVAALGMADDRVAAAGILQHLGADTAGKRPLRLAVAILGAERDRAAAERLTNRREQRRRRTDQEFAPMRLAGPGRDIARQRDTIGAQPVHLPVAGDKPLSLSHFHSPHAADGPATLNVAAPAAPLYTSRSTITPARRCCKPSAPERAGSSSRSCSGS